MNVYNIVKLIDNPKTMQCVIATRLQNPQLTSNIDAGEVSGSEMHSVIRRIQR